MRRERTYLRLKDGKCWTLLTTMTELKGFGEKRELASQGVQHGVFRNRQTWLERKTQEEADIGLCKRNPTVSLSAAAKAASAWAARLKRLEVPTHHY